MCVDVFYPFTVTASQRTSSRFMLAQTSKVHLPSSRCSPGPCTDVLPLDVVPTSLQRPGSATKSLQFVHFPFPADLNQAGLAWF